MRCDECEYWRNEWDERDGPKPRSGACRRYAPRPSSDHTDAYWTHTLPEDFCGEFVTRNI